MTKKIVVQVSGGIESTVLLALAIKEVGVDNVFPVCFNTGSLFFNHRDMFGIKRVCTNQQVMHKLQILNVPQIDILEYNRDVRYADVGFIPGFKLSMNIASLSYAQRVGAEEVWIGNMLDNEFPDESPEFIANTNKLYNDTYTKGEGLTFKTEIKTPFAGMSKEDAIRIGIDLGINIFDTVSCGDERLSGGFNCGVCPWCLKRRAAFERAKIEDCTRYVFASDANATLNDWDVWKNMGIGIKDNGVTG